MEKQEILRTVHTRFAKKILNPFHRALREFDMVRPGDRIAVCISGGKDSALLGLLLHDLAARQGGFEVCFLAMDPGYPAENRRRIEENMEQLGLPLHVFETDVLRIAGTHAAEHPCFLCAKMRRGNLYAQAQALGCNKIALGHHYDDAIETVLMGLIYGGQVQAMLPRLKARNYDGMELIRPLYFTREAAVSEWVETCGLRFLPCACPAAQRGQDTKRAEIKALIASLAAQNPQIEANILNAVKNDLLGICHSNKAKKFGQRLVICDFLYIGILRFIRLLGSFTLVQHLKGNNAFDFSGRRFGNDPGRIEILNCFQTRDNRGL